MRRLQGHRGLDASGGVDQDAPEFGRVSIVVPPLNESEPIRATLDALGALFPEEVIVVDGGSQDGTADIARSLGFRTLTEDGGLARQINAGARAASGDVLLFNYADTELPPDALSEVRRAVARSEVVGGSFLLGFCSDRLGYRIISAGANFRNRLGFGPFGDQTIFVRREVFFELGEYRPEAFLEDFDFVRRSQARGEFVTIPLAVRTSVRRWEEKGVVRTLLFHWGMSAAYLFGKRRSTSRFTRWMDHLRSRRGGGTSRGA